MMTSFGIVSILCVFGSAYVAMVTLIIATEAHLKELDK